MEARTGTLMHGLAGRYLGQQLEHWKLARLADFQQVTQQMALSAGQ